MDEKDTRDARLKFLENFLPVKGRKTKSIIANIFCMRLKINTVN